MLMITRCFSPFYAQAQSPQVKTLSTFTNVEAKPAAGNITVFGAEDGLALSSISCSIKDSHGNIWFGTFGGGVSKYDGKSFQNFTTLHGLPHNMIVSMVEDKYGDIWFGTFGGGVSRYNGTTFKTFDVNDGLIQNMVISMYEDKKGSMWFGTFEGGVSVYNGKSFKSIDVSKGLPNNKVWAITEDANGNMYFATDGGAATFDGRNFAIIKGTDGKIVRGITIDADQNIWLGTAADGILKISGNVVEQFTTANDLSDNAIWQITQDKRGRLWFGTESGGVISYDGERFTSITESEGLSHKGVRCITEDNYGGLWFGTYGGGVNRYDGRAVSFYGTQQGLSDNNVRYVMEDHSGNLWFATLGGGVSKFDGKQFVHFTTSSGLPTNQTRTLLEDHAHNIWIGTHGAGLSKFSGSSFTNYNMSSGLPNNNIRALMQDKSKHLWIGTDDGLVRFDGKNFKVFTTADGLAHNRVWSILQDRQGNYWFGTYGGGVSFYDGKKFVTYNASSTLPHNSILCLFEDSKGNIWIGGVGGGLTRFDGLDFFTFSSADGLPDETIYDVLETQDGKIWIGTNFGFCSLSFGSRTKNNSGSGMRTLANASLRGEHNFKFESFNTSTGYPIKDINTNAMCLTRTGFPNDPASKGIIWAGCGDDKIVRFDASSSLEHFGSPNVLLKNLKINDENLCWQTLKDDGAIDSVQIAQQEVLVYGKALNKKMRDTLLHQFKDVSFNDILRFTNTPIGLVLPHEFNRVTFEFNAIETSRYFLVNYQYMLEGQDRKWSPATKTTQATYSNLWEGKYVFKVRAQRAGGFWGEPTLLTFVVKPPWWREPWMYVIWLGLFLSIGFFLLRIRERRLIEEKIRLERTVSERTLEVVDQMNLAEQQKREAQRQREEADRQRGIVEERNEEIRKQLENTEACLSNLSLEMIQRFNAYRDLETELRRLAENDDPNKFKRVFSLIATNKSLEKEWDQFMFYFNNLYSDFDAKLKIRAHQLSNYELRICALIRMGMENREIAMMLNIEPSSVKMAKYRLKKKLQVAENIDLRTYFESL